MRLIHYRSNISMETIFMSTKNSKMNEPHTFFLNLLQRLNLLFKSFLFITPEQI